MNNDYYKDRSVELPNDAKNPSGAVYYQKPAPAPPEPPITRHVTLPEMVSVGYLAEITGQELSMIIDDLIELRCFLGINRSLGFEDAARFLRRYGIASERAA